MSVSVPIRTHAPTRFPTNIAWSYVMFMGMVWAGTMVFAFVLTGVVSIWNEIEISGWLIVGQAARWFVLGTMWHLGWVMFELYLTHGRTRRAFYFEALMTLIAFSLCAAVLYAITFPIEAVYYGLFGWQQGLGDANFASALDMPAIAIEAAAIFLLWGTGGFFVTTAWYRNGLLGAAATAFGLLLVAISSIALGERDGPARLVLDRLPVLAQPDGTPNLPIAMLIHIAGTALLAALSWIWIRDMPVHAKSE
jgi:hypothetical protein